jgi:hypothetical protein
MTRVSSIRKWYSSPVAAMVLFAAFIGHPAPGYGIDLLPDLFGGKEPEGTYLFQGGKQYVKLVKREQEDGAARAAVNDHPAELGADQVATVLGMITMQHTGGVIVEKTEALPVFSEREIQTLAPHISRGLARAQPDEEIIFMVAGRHPGMIAKEVMGSTGRVFYADGKLNLILGEVHKPMMDKGQKERALAAGCGDCPMDERVIYFRPASRNKAGKVPEPISTIAGVDFKKQGNKVRGDWLVLDVPTIVANVERQKNRLPPALEKERREAKLEAARAAAERRQMREEMARMRKEMQSGGGASGGSVEERLATLDNLKEKGLISAEEYESRRRDILKDI